MRHLNDVDDNEHTAKKTIIVVSGDAGGIKGLISTEVLNYIEKQTGKATADFAMFFTGSSTATIALTGLNSLDPNSVNTKINNHPYYSAEHVRDSYFEDGAIIFPSRRRIWSEIVKDDKSLSTIFKQRAFDIVKIPMGLKDSRLYRWVFNDEMFPSKNLERVLHKRFGHLTAKDIKKPFAFNTTNFSDAKPIWFTNSPVLARNKNDTYYVPNMPMDQLIGACVRPNFLFDYTDLEFEHVVFDDDNNEVTKIKTSIPTDGAYFAPSPDKHAYECAKEILDTQGLKEENYRIVLLSIGTGAQEIKNTLDDFKSKGMFRGHKDFAKTFEVFMALQYRADREQLKEEINRSGDLYMRIESTMRPEQNPEHPSLDLTDSSWKNMRRLVKFARETVIPEHKDDLDDFIAIIQEQDGGKTVEAIAKKRLGNNYKRLKKQRQKSKNYYKKLKR